MARFTAIVGVLLLLFGIDTVSARSYFLPDYQSGTFPKRVNDTSKEGKPVFSPDPRTCSDYFGFLSAYDKGNMNCGIVKHFPQIGYCYSDCGCDLDDYPYTSSNCEFELRGEVCTDTGGNKYYTSCVDPCEPFEDKDCNGFRCKETYEDEGCTDKCKVCYLNSCDYEENLSYPLESDCLLGCDPSGKIEGCSTRCKVCETCSYEGHSLEVCPASNTCSSKTCHGVTKYKITGCAVNYTDFDDYWCDTDFSAFIAKIKGDLL